MIIKINRMKNDILLEIYMGKKTIRIVNCTDGDAVLMEIYKDIAAVYGASNWTNDKLETTIHDITEKMRDIAREYTPDGDHIRKARID